LNWYLDLQSNIRLGTKLAAFFAGSKLLGFEKNKKSTLQRNEENKLDEQQYRGHLIRVISTENPGTKYWVARADVRFQDQKGLRFIPVDGPRREFVTKEEAEQSIIGEAKKVIDLHTKE
jgi:hypothetical protein